MKLYCVKCNKYVAELSGKMLPGTTITATCKQCIKRSIDDSKKYDMPDFMKDIFK